MSSSTGLWSLTDTTGNIIYATNDPRFSVNGQINITGGDSISLQLRVTDTAGQVMPAETRISVSAAGVKLTGTSAITVASTIGSAYNLRNPDNSEKAEENGHTLRFTLTDIDEEVSEGTALSISIVAPSGSATTGSVPFRT